MCDSTDWSITHGVALRLLACTSSTAPPSWLFAACQWLAVEQADCVAPASSHAGMSAAYMPIVLLL